MIADHYSVLWQNTQSIHDNNPYAVAMRQQRRNMARLEIPALYRLDVGSSKWGWHKMSDLVEAVDQLMERMPEDFLPSLEVVQHASQKIIHWLKAKRLLTQFGHLNNEPLMAWSDESEIRFDSTDKVPWDRPNLFIPAQWSMAVIDWIKERETILDVWTLFDKYGKRRLNLQEQRVLSLRLGKETGRRENLQYVANIMQTSCERVRTIEARAKRKLQRCVSSTIPGKASAQQVDLAQQVSNSDLLENIPTFNVRASNAFYNARIETIGDLKQKTLKEMLKIRNLGMTGARHISDVMLSRGIDLGWFK